MTANPGSVGPAAEIEKPRRVFTIAGDVRFVVLGLAAAALVRVPFLLLLLSRGWTNYERDEVRVARALLDGHGFAFNYFGLFGNALVPGAFFPPAYVYEAYWIMRLAGTETALAVQNVVFSLAVLVLVYEIAHDAFGRTAARAALWVGVFYLPFFSRVTHGSPVYFKMLFMCLAAWSLQRAWRGGRTRDVVAAGAWIGLLALAMPDVLVYAALVALAFPFRWRRPRALASRLVLFGLATFVPILPWTVRNAVRFHRFCLISSNGGMNFYMGHCAMTHNEPDFTALTALDDALGGELERADEFARDKIFYREGWRYAREHPVEDLRRVLQRGFLHWTFRPSLVGLAESDTARASPGSRFYSRSYVLAYALLLPVAAWGLWRSRRRLFDLVPLLLIFVYSMAVSMMFVVQTKQRLIKVEPVLVVFAGVAIAGWWEAWRRRAGAIRR